MAKSKSIDVDLLQEYPTGHVAEHEVFMSFNSDDDAIAFHEWWDTEGKAKFEKWREKHAE